MIRDVESYRENVGMLLVYMCSYVCRANVGKSMYFTNECAPKKLDQYKPMHLCRALVACALIISLVLSLHSCVACFTTTFQQVLLTMPGYIKHNVWQ